MRVFSWIRQLKYRWQQRRNLLYPNEEYIFSPDNENKADLHRMQYVFNLHKDLEGSMLDIGCNDGFFMRAFPWRFSLFVGVDLFSIDAFTRGKYRATPEKYTLNGKIRYIQGEFEKLGPVLGVFDFVFAGEVIEHVLDEELFLRAFVKTLKPTSHWCITTPNDVGVHLPEHNRQYSIDSLRMLLSRYFNDFEVRVLPSPGDSWPFLVAFGQGRKV